MLCNLVKTIKKGKNKEGEDVNFSNYYLEFQNGKKCYISPRYINSDNVKDAEKKKDIEESNKNNAIRLDAMADLKKDE